MDHKGALCPDGDPEQGLTAGHFRGDTNRARDDAILLTENLIRLPASFQEKEHCSPLASSGNHQSLQETHHLCFPADNTRICKYASVKDVVISILLILAMSLTVAAHCSPSCPHQWIGYEGKCYFFSLEKRNWPSSQKFCSRYNASLACIESEEKDFVMRIKGEDTYWIGLAKNSDPAWICPNGEYSTMKVTGGGDCVYLDNEASSSGCHTELPCICSKAAG